MLRRSLSRIEVLRLRLRPYRRHSLPNGRAQTRLGAKADLATNVRIEIAEDVPETLCRDLALGRQGLDVEINLTAGEAHELRLWHDAHDALEQRRRCVLSGGGRTVIRLELALGHHLVEPGTTGNVAGDGHLVKWLVDASVPFGAAMMPNAGRAETVAVLNGPVAALDCRVDEGPEGAVRVGMPPALAGLGPLIDGRRVEGGNVDGRHGHDNGKWKWILVFRNPLRHWGVNQADFNFLPGPWPPGREAKKKSNQEDLQASGPKSLFSLVFWSFWSRRTGPRGHPG